MANIDLYFRIFNSLGANKIILMMVFFGLIGCSTPFQSRSKLSKEQYQLQIGQTQDDIRSVLYQNLNLFISCRNQAISTYGDKIKGDITVVFVVKPNGEIQRVGVEETSLPVKFRACLLKALYDIRFRPTQTGRSHRVSQPLNLDG